MHSRQRSLESSGTVVSQPNDNSRIILVNDQQEDIEGLNSEVAFEQAPAINDLEDSERHQRAEISSRLKRFQVLVMQYIIIVAVLWVRVRFLSKQPIEFSLIALVMMYMVDSIWVVLQCKKQ